MSWNLCLLFARVATNGFQCVLIGIQCSQDCLRFLMVFFSLLFNGFRSLVLLTFCVYNPWSIISDVFQYLFSDFFVSFADVMLPHICLPMFANDLLFNSFVGVLDDFPMLVNAHLMLSNELE